MAKLAKDVPYLPVKDLVLIEEIKFKGEVISKGGIVLPNMGIMERLQFGRILAQGEGAISALTGTRIEMDTVVGDEVAYVAKAGREVRCGSKTYKLIREVDVWAITNPHSEHRKTVKRAQ